LDIQALQAKLAAQEARLNDLQAKIGGGSGGTAANVTSIRKNAKVTIGGTVNTRYFFHTGKYKTYNNDGTVATSNNYKLGDFKVSDANINFKIDVNDYFDAFVRANLQDGTNPRRSGYQNAQFAWIRWKNLCNSGFGIVIGRDALVFGAGGQSGYDENQGYAGNGTKLQDDINKYVNSAWKTGYDHNRTTQITPYWESQDGKIKAEISFFQNIEAPGGGSDEASAGEFRSFNYGLGTMSGRLTVKPIEGLRLVASFMNRYSSHAEWDITNYWYNTAGNNTRNNTAANFGFDYTPACFTRLKIFAQWTHDWNAGWIDNAKADATNFGFNFKLTEQLTFITQGEYLRWKGGTAKVSGWAVWPGFRYVLPYGVNFEVAYRYERLTRKESGIKAAKGNMSTIYGQVGFNF
jgi:hypothetical protein